MGDQQMAWHPVFTEIVQDRATTAHVLQPNALDSRTESGWRSIHFASVVEGKTSWLGILLAHGINPNLCTLDRTTPLHIAARHSIKNVRSLLLHKASPWMKTEEGNLEVITELMQYAYNDHQLYNASGLSPLESAIFNGNLDAVRLMMDFADSETLHFAVQSEQYEIVEFLLASKLKQRSVNGKTPLQLSNSLGFEEISKLLSSPQPSGRTKTRHLFYRSFSVSKLVNKLRVY